MTGPVDADAANALREQSAHLVVVAPAVAAAGQEYDGRARALDVVSDLAGGGDDGVHGEDRNTLTDRSVSVSSHKLRG
ncbi:hypothetical protein [Kribbella sp. NPDC000426]|uniref:hypothetical protein n=1 Tax=Kribbella sp. NPDC000426 TaxID=3154255 RepID=UPI003327431A